MTMLSKVENSTEICTLRQTNLMLSLLQIMYISAKMRNKCKTTNVDV